MSKASTVSPLDGAAVLYTQRGGSCPAPAEEFRYCFPSEGMKMGVPSPFLPSEPHMSPACCGLPVIQHSWDWLSLAGGKTPVV